jgi:hypothetical protein
VSLTHPGTNAPVGYHPETHDVLQLPDHIRYDGMYVLGTPGAGKSSLLINLILNDLIANHSVIVIDPHGDLVQHVIARMPEEKLQKTYLLDMEDEAYPFGVNVFSSGERSNSTVQAQAVDRVMHVFEALWPEVMEQAHLPCYLRAATLALLANPGATLVDMQDFLQDSDFRARLLKNVEDPTVQQFWHTQYDELSEAERMKRVQPLIGRLESLFMRRRLVRNIIGQKRTSLDFRQAIENKETILIKLPIKTLAQDSRLIGTMLIAQIHNAMFSFADLPQQMRPSFNLYVDEFQYFATPGFSDIFTESRKFGARVTVAHQYRGQLPAYLQASTMTAKTKVCFQTTPEDAKEMAHVFASEQETTRRGDIDLQATEHLLTHGSDSPQVREFIKCYLRPLQAQKKSGTVEILNSGTRWEHTSHWLLNVEPPKEKSRVVDPTPYLNHLLYQVMKTGQADMPIPNEIIYGFSIRKVLWLSQTP